MIMYWDLCQTYSASPEVSSWIPVLSTSHKLTPSKLLNLLKSMCMCCRPSPREGGSSSAANEGAMTTAQQALQPQMLEAWLMLASTQDISASAAASWAVTGLLVLQRGLQLSLRFCRHVRS